MKIAFIYDAMYPWVTGGAEKRVYELATRLARRGHEVHCYSWGWWWKDKGEQNIIFEGIHLHGVGKPIDLYKDDKRSVKEALLFAWKLLPVLNQEKFDIVDCQGFPFFSCFVAKQHAMRGNSKLVITLLEVWGDYWYQYMGSVGFFGKLVEKITLRLSNRLISISPQTDRELQKIRTVKDAVIIPPGLNFKEIREVEPYNLEDDEKKWDIIYAGRLIKDKRVDLLIKSLALVKKSLGKVNCLIIGEGPEEAKLHELTEKLNLESSVEFTGFFEDQMDLISRFKSSKIFVLPSQREGFGMVVVEANACGLPVVVINNPLNAAMDLIDAGRNGFIADANAEDLKEKIIKTLKNSSKMRTDCIHSAEQYDWDKIVRNLDKFYQESLAIK
nr:glycosyltransferase family 4 protein [uncultured Methanobacterium sp.]